MVGTAKADFLGNETKAMKGLPDMIPADAEHVLVISCGLGVQTVAAIADAPVYSATNTIKRGGQHGMALTKKACEACAQCYLGIPAVFAPWWIAPRVC